MMPVVIFPVLPFSPKYNKLNIIEADFTVTENEQEVYDYDDHT
jgi:hypothetical protein